MSLATHRCLLIMLQRNEEKRGQGHVVDGAEPVAVYKPARLRGSVSLGYTTPWRCCIERSPEAWSERLVPQLPQAATPDSRHLTWVSVTVRTCSRPLLTWSESDTTARVFGVWITSAFLKCTGVHTRSMKTPGRWLAWPCVYALWFTRGKGPRGDQQCHWHLPAGQSGPPQHLEVKSWNQSPLASQLRLRRIIGKRL